MILRKRDVDLSYKSLHLLFAENTTSMHKGMQFHSKSRLVARKAHGFKCFLFIFPDAAFLLANTCTNERVAFNGIKRPGLLFLLFLRFCSLVFTCRISCAFVVRENQS